VQSRDENANPVFADEDIKLAMRQAVLNSHGKFFSSATTTLTYVLGTNEYTIDDSIQRIVLVQRERSGVEVSSNLIGGVSFDETITSYRHFNFGKGSNKLIFYRDFPDCTMNIFYERDVPVPLESRVLGAAISTTTATSMTLTDANPQLFHLSLPAYLRIDNEIVKVTAISGNTTATIARGQLGSTAATHSNGATVSQVLFADSDRFYNFLFAEMGRLLNLWRVQSGTGQVDVSANLTASRLFKEDAQAVSTEHPQAQRPRRMKFVRERRPRRGI
jgi:hypothetical protein